MDELIQYYMVYSSFSPFLVCNLLFQKWETCSYYPSCIYVNSVIYVCFRIVNWNHHWDNFTETYVWIFLLLVFECSLISKDSLVRTFFPNLLKRGYFMCFLQCQILYYCLYSILEPSNSSNDFFLLFRFMNASSLSCEILWILTITVSYTIHLLP